MKPSIHASIRQILFCVVLIFTATARADKWSMLFPHDIDVMTVTKVTEEGRTYPNATLANPVYYKIIDLGEQAFGRVWAGESIPSRRSARKWLMTALVEQGYRLADEQHPPTQLLVFIWGMTQGIGIEFFGFNPRIPPFHPNGVVSKALDFTDSDLFLGMVRSFTMDSETSPQTTLLWETRFACPANGLALSDALPLLIHTAAANFGRETKLPVNINASDRFKGRVDFGELKIMGVVPSSEMKHQKTENAPIPPEPR